MRWPVCGCDEVPGSLVGGGMVGVLSLDGPSRPFSEGGVDAFAVSIFFV